jgi:hypothetical protein
MRLVSITPLNVGPFDSDATIPLDPEVTVLTGENDCGKSIALRVVELLSLDDNQLTETSFADLVNREYSETTQGWRSRNSVGCDAVVELTQSSLKQFPTLSLGDKLHISFRFQPGHNTSVGNRVERSGGGSAGPSVTGFRPTVTRLPDSERLRDIISFRDPNSVEARLLRLAFGVSYSEVPKGSNASRAAAVRKAEDRLNSHLEALLGTSERLRLALGPESTGFTVHVRDVGGELTPLTWRGTGIQAVLGHLVSLLEVATAKVPTIVIFDEPELHLHADLQHALRFLLERAGALEHIQVVYATHSSCMINNRRPERVRLFRKAVDEDRTSVRVEARPFKENWLPVREGLGLTAADSLLYGDITVIVEGDTELLSIPMLLQKLADNNVSPYPDVVPELEKVHWLPAGGDSVSYFVKLALSQGNRVIVLLDSDKARKKAELEKEHPDLPILLLPEPYETEDLIPRPVYLSALGATLRSSDADGRVTLEAYATWETDGLGEGTIHAKMLTSKRVERWLKDLLPGVSYPKAQVMHTAVLSARADDLATAAESLRPLAAAIFAPPNAGRSGVARVPPRWRAPGSFYAPETIAAPKPTPRITDDLEVRDVTDSGSPDRDGDVRVRGRVFNKGSRVVHGVVVAIDAWDKDGKKIGSKDSTATPSNVGPGEAAAFSDYVRIGSTEAFDHTSVTVLSAEGLRNAATRFTPIEIAAIRRHVDEMTAVEVTTKAEKSAGRYNATGTLVRMEGLSAQASSLLPTIARFTKTDYSALRSLLPAVFSGDIPNDAWTSYLQALKEGVVAMSEE